MISNGLGTPPSAWPAIAGDRGLQVATWYYRGSAGGSKPADRARTTVSDHVADLLALMDAEGLQRAVLVAWSIGVNVAFELARTHPERVAGLLAVAGVPGGTFGAMGARVLVPGPLRHRFGVTGARALRRLAPVLNLIRPLVPANRVTATLINHSGFMLPRARPEVVLDVITEFREHDWGWYFDLALGMAPHESMDVSFVDVPVTLLAGRWDVLADHRAIQAAARAIPHAEYRVLPGSHFLPLEFPQEMHRALLDLLPRCELEA